MKAFKFETYREEYRPTSNNWYPNFPNNTVKIKCGNLSDGMFRVCVWGADDFGMELDFYTKMDALDMFNKLPAIISIKDLESFGFHRA